MISTQEVTTVQEETPVTQTIHTESHGVVGTEPPQKVYDKKKTVFRFHQIVYYILGVIETLLVFRFFLKLVGANPASGFASFIYALSDPFALPFNGVFGVAAIGTSLYEWSIIVAMIFYAVFAYGLVQLMQFIKPVSPHEVEHQVR